MNISQNANIYGQLKLGTINNVETAILALQSGGGGGGSVDLTPYLKIVDANSTYAKLSTANTWTGTQTFNNITITGNETTSGTDTNTTLNVTGNTTLGTTSTNTLTVNSTPTLKAGLIVQSGTITLPTNSISASAINGGVGATVGTANTWTALQTFNNNIGLPSTTKTASTVNQIGYTLTSQNLTVASSQITASAGNYAYTTLTLTSPINSVWIVNAQIGLRANATGTIQFNYWGVQLGSSFSYGMTTYGMKTMLNITANTAYFDTTSCVVVTTALNQNIVSGQNITISGGGCQVHQYSLSATRIA